MSTLKTHNLQSPDAGSVNIAMAPNAGMVVTGISTFSNKIGVGNVSPNRTLTVTSNGGQIDLHDTDNSTLGIYMNAGNASLYCRGNSTLGNGSMGGVFTVHTHPAGGSIQERLRITSDGKLLVGTTNDGSSGVDNLILYRNGNGGITIRNNSNQNGNIYFSRGTSGTDEYKGYIQYQHAQDVMVFGTGHTERLRITSEGQVKLSGTNSGNHMSSFGTNVGGLTIDDVGNQHTALEVSHGSNKVFLVASSNNSVYMSSYGTGNFILEHTGSGGTRERVRINSSGDVGIGYDSPSCKLAIRDTTEFTAYGGVTPNSGNILLQLWNNPPNETANDHASMQFAVNGGTHNRVNTISAVAESASNRKLAFAFCTDEAGSRTEKMRIHGDGYVTKPETPSWVMRPSYSSNQTLGNSSVHAIGWTAADNNTHAKGVRLKNVTLSGSGFSNNLHNGQSVGKITVPVAGIYYVWCTIRMENQNNAGNIYLYVDGSQIVRQHVEGWNADRYIHGRIQHIVTCNANSYIIWGVGCNGGVVSGVNDTVNWCGGYLIG